MEGGDAGRTFTNVNVCLARQCGVFVSSLKGAVCGVPCAELQHALWHCTLGICLVLYGTRPTGLAGDMFLAAAVLQSTAGWSG
jgi:hypothetical protein